MRRTLLVVGVGAYLLMRSDKELCGSFDLLETIDEMKRRYPSAIESGGGHRCAGTIKLRDKALGREMTNSLINLIRDELGTK